MMWSDLGLFCGGSSSNGFSETDWLCRSDHFRRLKRCVPHRCVFLMIECVCSCEDFIVFLFVVIGFMPRTSCILIFLFHLLFAGVAAVM